MLSRLLSSLSQHQIGFLLMLVTVMCFPAMDTIAKILTQTQPVMQVVWARYAGQFLLLLMVFAPHLKRVMHTRYLGLQLARSAALFSATICFFTSLFYLDQGLATAIFQVAPLVITVLAVLFLGETIGVRRIICLLVGFVGAIVIVQPQSSSFSIASLLPLCAASLYASYSILTRFLGPSEDARTTLFYTAGCGAVVSSLILPLVWVAPDSERTILLMLSMSLFGSIGHYSLILALNKVSATDLAPVNYLTLVFAMIWGLLLFHEVPSAATLSGSALVVGSGLYLWQRTRYLERENTDL